MQSEPLQVLKLTLRALSAPILNQKKCDFQSVSLDLVCLEAMLRTPPPDAEAHHIDCERVSLWLFGLLGLNSVWRSLVRNRPPNRLVGLMRCTLLSFLAWMIYVQKVIKHLCPRTCPRFASEVIPWPHSLIMPRVGQTTEIADAEMPAGTGFGSGCRHQLAGPVALPGQQLPPATTFSVGDSGK